MTKKIDGLRSLLALVSFVFASVAWSQAEDATIARAAEQIAAAEAGIASLQRNDVETYNRLGNSLTQVGESLAASSSQQHPQFPGLVQRWTAAREAMIAIAADWNGASPPVAAQPQRAAADSASAIDASQLPANVEAVMAKYQRENRPTLGDQASLAQAQTWVAAIRPLQTTQLEQDFATLKAMVGSKVTTPDDAERAWRWMSDQFQQQISGEISAQVDRANGRVGEAVQLSELLQTIDPSEEIRAYNFTQEDNGANNLRLLNSGKEALAISVLFASSFDIAQAADHRQSASQIDAGLQHFATLQVAGAAGAATLAAAPTAKPKQRPVILPSVEQKFWYRGAVIGEVDKRGGIWIESRKVGDITNTGEIWVNGINKGSIEPDGRVWQSGSQVGSLEADGKVWRRGNQVGSVDDAGKVWVTGESSGSIEAFQGEWKRAAIVFFFDFFK